MCQFCYSSRDQELFKRREFFVGKVWSVIRETEWYRKAEADRMAERFLNKEPINIESEFLL